MLSGHLVWHFAGVGFRTAANEDSLSGEDDAATLYSLDQGSATNPRQDAIASGSTHRISIGARHFRRADLVGPDQIDGFWLQNGQDHPLLLEPRRIDALRPAPPVPSERVAELREDVGSPTILKTDRLILREVRNSDVEAFQHYMLRELIGVTIRGSLRRLNSVAALVGRFTRSQSQRPRTDYFLAAVDKRSDEFVGEASLRVRGIPPRQGAIGYGVTSSRVGQGFATEIGRGLLRLAFETLDLHRVDAQCRAENHASRGVMAKLGMREEGVFRDNLFVRGEWWSTVHSAILSTDQSTSSA